MNCQEPLSVDPDVTMMRLITVVQEMYFSGFLSVYFVFTTMHPCTFSYCHTVNRKIQSVSSILCHINNTVCKGLYWPFSVSELISMIFS